MADFNNLFKKKSETGTAMSSHGTYKITWLHYKQLTDNSRQYCPGTEDEIEHMADLIAAAGRVMQNLIVKKVGEGYEIIAGHKRREAVRRLVEVRGLEAYAMLPCEIANDSDPKERFAIIATNAHHDKTPYEIMYELQELKYLIENYPDEFPDLQKGRMVERLAKQMGLARSVVSDYQNIANNLGDKGMELFANGQIDKSTATALAGLDKGEQEVLIDAGKLTHKEVKDYKQKKSTETGAKQSTVAVSLPMAEQQCQAEPLPAADPFESIQPITESRMKQDATENVPDYGTSSIDESNDNAKIIFRNAEHQVFYKKYLEKCRYQDAYHKALVYCLGISEDTRVHVDSIYDFKSGNVLPECLNQGWQTSGSAKVICLAYNLYCGGTPSVYDYENESVDVQLCECQRYAVDDIFCCSYARYFFEAIKIRYPEYCDYREVPQ